jgi:hypothetical protein
VAALKGGGFVVAWVSEQERSSLPVLTTNTYGTNSSYYTASSAVVPSVDIYARLFQSNGLPVGNEFLVDTSTNPCAHPSVAAATDGSFMVAWSAYDMSNRTNGWDVYARPFTSAGVGGAVVQLNTYVYANQFRPHISAIGLDYLAVWTSVGEDGSRDGVYGQYVHNDGSLVGSEFRVNTTTLGQQMQPAIASDGAEQFITVWTGWTSITNEPNTFDLYAQRYINVAAVLDPMSAPYVWAPFILSSNVYQPQLVVSWASVLGISISNYEVYVNGSSSAVAAVTTNAWTMTAANGLTTSSTNSFQLDYVTTAGLRSPLSAAATGATWSGASWGGIPVEWMDYYYGTNKSVWPAAGGKLAANETLYQVFLSGGNPLLPSTWLSQQLVKTSQGIFLNWNTQPGATYQVQLTTNLLTWNNFGSARFAAGTNDSLYVGSSTAGYYRIVLLRQ